MSVKTSSRQRGVSIVESLVALVILSIGLLGIAALYVESVKANRTAVMRTQAVNLVTDMADRIRSNRFAQNAYALAVGATPAQQGCVIANDCTAVQLATDDLAWWVAAVRNTLPRSPAGAWPQTQIDVAVGAVGTPDQYTITVRWWEPGEAAQLTHTSVVRMVPISPL